MFEFIGSVIFLVIFIVMIVMSNKENKTRKKQHEELIASKEILVATYGKMIVALDSLKIDVVDYNNLKIRISTLLGALEEHSELIEQHTKEVKTVFTPSIIIKDVDVDVETLQSEIAKSGVFSIPEDAMIEMIPTSTLQSLRELVKTQGMPGNWDQDEYMRGMYNGMELMLATAENREPVYKELRKGWKKFDEQ